MYIDAVYYIVYPTSFNGRISFWPLEHQWPDAPLVVTVLDTSINAGIHVQVGILLDRWLGSQHQ